MLRERMIVIMRSRSGMVVLAAASYSYTGMGANFVFIIVVTGLWRPPRIGCKRRRRGIWIHYEVGDL